MSNATPGTAGGPNGATVNGGGLDRLLSKLRGTPLLPVLIAGAASIAALVALLLWAQAPDYRVLYSNFSEADGGRIIAELDKRGVPYRLSDGGNALLVPAGQMHALRLQLAEQGLPQAGNVGFELMDKQAFGVSQFAEHINFQRGLEGELARSIESLGPVAKARVHLAMAKQSIFVRDRQPASASVVLTLQPGRSLGEGQVEAIVHMVSSSVPQLATEAVTVVDQSGRLLSVSGGENRDLDGSQLSYIDEVESSYQRRIERILTPILGAENVRAQVAVDIDFANREQTAERFSPNQNPGAAAIRSQQSSENYNGDGLASGIPGALSNTPPVAAPAPAATQDAAGGQQNAAAPGDAPASARGQAQGSMQRDNLVNYEVDRSVEHVQLRRGSIKRLTAAVVVNYRSGVDADGKPTREPLSTAELEQINRLVRQAMGYSDNRGDQLEVVNSPFTEATETVVASVWWQTPEFFVMATSIARYLMVALAALLLWLLLLRPLMRRYTAPPVVASEEAGETASAAPSGNAIGAAGSEPAGTTDAADATTGELQRRMRRRSAVYEHNLATLREMAQEDPRLIAMIVSGWIKKND